MDLFHFFIVTQDFTPSPSTHMKDNFESFYRVSLFSVLLGFYTKVQGRVESVFQSLALFIGTNNQNIDFMRPRPWV